MFRLRSHTASAHKMKITEYKNRFGADLDILEVVFHRSWWTRSDHDHEDGDHVHEDGDHVHDVGNHDHGGGDYTTKYGLTSTSWVNEHSLVFLSFKLNLQWKCCWRRLSTLP